VSARFGVVGIQAKVLKQPADRWNYDLRSVRLLHLAEQIEQHIHVEAGGHPHIGRIGREPELDVVLARQISLPTLALVAAPPFHFLSGIAR